MRRSPRPRPPIRIERGGLPPTELGPLDGALCTPVSGPAAPAELRAQPPGPDGIRQGLVQYYRELIARGELDTPERFAAAEERLIDSLLGSR